MGRRPTKIGHYGKIRTTEVRPGLFESRARVRLDNGEFARPCSRANSRTAAEDGLRDTITELLRVTVSDDEITRDSRVRDVCALYAAELKMLAGLGEISHNTARIYRGHLNTHIKPKLGALTLREVTVLRCERVIFGIRDATSYETAKSVRAALRNLLQYAVRHRALDANPVVSMARMGGAEDKPVVAMTLEQRTEMLTALEKYVITRQKDSMGRDLGSRGDVWRYLPDVVRAMLATGIRIGELLALDGSNIDRAACTVSITHHLVRIEGEGLVRVPKRKSGAPELILAVPMWSSTMWARRKLAAGHGRPLFPSARAGWRDPSNMINTIRDAMDECGFDWVTSHIWRHTVGTVLDEAGLETTAIADQLGNSRAVAEKHYRARRVANPASAEALEGMWGADQEIG